MTTPLPVTPTTASLVVIFFFTYAALGGLLWSELVRMGMVRGRKAELGEVEPR